MRGLSLLLLLCVSGCGQRSGSVHQRLSPGGVVAVGSWELSRQIVEKGPHDADWVEQWSDAARVARDMTEHRPSASRAVSRGALARALLESLNQAELERAAVTEQEIDATVAKAWLELKRPRAVRFGEIFLAVGLVESDERARAQMEQLRERVLSAESTSAFGQLAGQAASEMGIEISARMWPPVAGNGTVVPLVLGDDPTEKVPKELVAAASELREPGDKSAVVGTAGGYHLLVAHEIVPERIVSPEDLPSVTRPLVAADRGSEALGKLRKNLRQRTSVVLADNRKSLFQLAWRKR